MKAKNSKLAEERNKRIAQVKEKSKDEKDTSKEDDGQMHPSRLARMAVLGPKS